MEESLLQRWRALEEMRHEFASHLTTLHLALECSRRSGVLSGEDLEAAEQAVEVMFDKLRELPPIPAGLIPEFPVVQ